MSINRKLIRPDMSAARQAVSDKRKKAPPIETAAFAPRSSSASDNKTARDALMNEVRLAIASAL